MPSRIGSADVAWLVATTLRLGQLSDDLGGVRMSDALTAHARTGEALLETDMQEPVRRELLVALADLHETAGWAAGDAGLRDRARQHYAHGIDPRDAGVRLCLGAGSDRPRGRGHRRAAQSARCSPESGRRAQAVGPLRDNAAAR